MSKRMVLGALMAAVCGCAGDEEPPSCQIAVTHYYEAGCKLVNLQTGMDYTAAEIISDCKQALATFPASCDGALADFRVCFGNVPKPARSNADCDCTAEQDALLTCQ